MSGRVVAVVFQKGGLGDTGRHAVAQALRRGGDGDADADAGEEAGVHLRVVARDPDMLRELLSEEEFNSPRLTKIKADPATDLDALEDAFRGAEAVVSTLGNRQYGFERFGARGTENVLATMEKVGVNRLVCISSVGINEDWPPMEWNPVIRFAFSAMLLTVLRSAVRDLSALENKVRASALDYLIVRPCGLGPEEKPVGTYKIRTGPEDGPLADQVAKADVGKFLVQEALEPFYHRTAVTIGKAKPEEEEGA